MFTVTFYSFKGGVGRTLALMNVAVDLVKKGEKVTVIDFDLEAPGLTTFDEFKKCNKKGVVDYVSEFIKSWPNPCVPDIKNFLYQSKTPSIKKQIGDSEGELWIMPASKSADIKTIDWRDLYTNKKGFYLFEELKAQIFKFTNSNYILIDSRTGLTDHSSICTKQMPDLIVSIFFPNDQNIQGMANVISNVKKIEKNDRKKPVIYVASRLPTGDDEHGILEKKLDKAREVLNYKKDPILRDYFTLHHNSRTDLIDQYLLIKEPSDRVLLKSEYIELSNGIETYNQHSLRGSQEFLHNIVKKRRERRGFLDKIDLEQYIHKIDYISKAFYSNEIINISVVRALGFGRNSEMNLRRIFHQLLAFSIYLKNSNDPKIRDFKLKEQSFKNKSPSEATEFYTNSIILDLNYYDNIEFNKLEILGTSFQELAVKVFSDKNFILNSKDFYPLDKTLVTLSNMYIIRNLKPKDYVRPDSNMVEAVRINFMLNYEEFSNFALTNKLFRKIFFRNLDYLNRFSKDNNFFSSERGKSNFPIEYTSLVEDLIFDKSAFLNFFYKTLLGLQDDNYKKIDREFKNIPDYTQIFLFEKGLLSALKVIDDKSIRIIDIFFGLYENFNFFSFEDKPINFGLRLNLSLKLLISSKILLFNEQLKLFLSTQQKFKDDSEKQKQLYSHGLMGFIDANETQLNSEYKKNLEEYNVKVNQMRETSLKLVSTLLKKDPNVKILSPINGTQLSLNQYVGEVNKIFEINDYSSFRELICPNASKVFYSKK